MDKIRAGLAAKNSKSRGNNSTQATGDNASFPFWNIPEDTSATVRFLPDGDPDNIYFWVNREVIRLPFEGVVGGDYPTDRKATVTVPCVDMFGMPCPIIAATRPWWKDPSTEALARTYWKKKSYIFQGFVVNSPLEEQNVPENPIRRFVINPMLFEIIEKSLISPDMEDSPTDYVGGRDFKIAKTRKGEWANYGTSAWSFKVRSLNEAERDAIDRFGLFDLKQFLGRRPDADEMDAIKAMFEASVNGEPFDTASFGKYYRAYTGRGENDDLPVSRSTAASSTPTASSDADQPAAPAAASQTLGRTTSPSDILERIRQRSAK